MRLWHCTLIIVLILTLPIVSCGGSPKDTDLQNYLTQASPLIDEIWDISLDLENMLTDAGPFGLSNVSQKLTTYSEKYDDLLSRFKAIECPKDALKLREYTIDIISYSKQIVDEAVAYATTRDTKHIDRVESYTENAEESHLLAIDEWDRLADMAGEGDGISIGEIFLGILAFGVAVSIALLILQLTIGIGFGIIAGIIAGIGAVVEKIKGAVTRKPSEKS